MKRLLALLIGSLAAIAGLLAVVGLPAGAGQVGPARAAAATPAQRVGLKVLLINADGTAGVAAADWANTLQREGVPFDEVTTNPASLGSVPLPSLSNTLGDGTQVANYEGVIVSQSGSAGLSPAQWTALQTFEHQFQVRQVTAYAVPSADIGMTYAGSTYTGTTAGAVLTPAGQSVFPYLKGLALDPGTFGYFGTPSPPAGASVQTLVSGAGNTSLLGLYTASDGRQTLFQTFNENPYMIQSQLLRHGELAWLARNTFFGDERNYLETHIDDNFLPDDTWSTATHSTDYAPADALRETPSDVTTAAAWSRAHGFRIDMLYNGGGSSQQISATGNDPLLTQFKATDPATSKPYTGDFGWINHTWDHPNLDQGCASQAYIQSELSQNNSWATSTLGLTATTDPSVALGANNPGVLVTGEHAGLANLIPGNPGAVDPPEFDTATPGTGGALAAGTYTYAITDDFAAGGGESSASQTQVTVLAAGSSALSWTAVCHAAEYKVYRQAPGSTTWSLLTTIPATASNFTNTGPGTISYTDLGGTGAPATTAPGSVNNAFESAYEANQSLPAAFSALAITDFGSDASKPYPNPPTATFANGAPPAAQYAKGATWQIGSATAIPRYPTNVYYNVDSNAQEADEYNTLYLPTGDGVGKCGPPRTDCSPSGTAAYTLAQIVSSIDFAGSGMFQHMMDNDPRPHYFHQTNLMNVNAGSEPAGEPTGTNALYYQLLDPLLAQYRLYFADNAPIIQLTMPQIGALLQEQAAWSAAKAAQVTGSIQGNQITVNNGGAAVPMPLTGVATVGSDYAGSHSGWTSAPSGTSTYTAITAWPAPPSTPLVVVIPSGPAPGPQGTVVAQKPLPAVVTPVTKPTSKATAPVAYLARLTKPATVSVRHNKVTVALVCVAARGRSARGRVCQGTLKLSVSGRDVSRSFRIVSGRTFHVTVALPKAVRTAIARAIRAATATLRRHPRHRAHPAARASVTVSTRIAHTRPMVSRGVLNIRT